MLQKIGRELGERMDQLKSCNEHCTSLEKMKVILDSSCYIQTK